MGYSSGQAEEEVDAGNGNGHDVPAAAAHTPNSLSNASANLLPQETHGADEPGDADADDDADSAYGSLAGSSRTGSLTSSIYNYVYENGRRYHAYRSGQYVLPNDEAEQERLDLQHHIWRLLLDGALYTAPLKVPRAASSSSSSSAAAAAVAKSKPAPAPAPAPAPEEAGGDGDFRILDLGTGTGIWAIDMADEFPRAAVFGVDLSPIQPKWVPSNCRFHVDDYEDDWTYREDEKFDYIHGRALSGTVADWARFYKQVRTHLKPGGWCEMQEYDAWIFSDDDSMDRATWTSEWIKMLDEASLKYGKRLNVARFHKQWMIEAGFQDVQEKVVRVSEFVLSSDDFLFCFDLRAVLTSRLGRSPSAPGRAIPSSRSSGDTNSCTCRCRQPRTRQRS
jgi:SAM-dependent methyltransferase